MQPVDLVMAFVFVGIIVLVGLFVVRSVGSMVADTGRIKNGLQGTALIESIAETGVTISTPSIGPEAPVYKFGLLVSAPGTAAPYRVETRQAVPRIQIPFAVPGARVPVDIDPKKATVVKISWARHAHGGVAGSGMTVTFANGVPVSGEAELVEAVRDGSMPTETGSAAELLMSGTRAQAVITTAMPLGKRAGDVNPRIDPALADDPIWLFTVKVEAPGMPAFPAMFGHRVPKDRLSSVAPGMRLAVAFNPANPSQEVAIDWIESPVPAAV